LISDHVLRNSSAPPIPPQAVSGPVQACRFTVNLHTRVISLLLVAGKVDHVAQSDAIARVIAFAPYASELRNHVAAILQSPMFKVSPRSQHLLQYVVDKALDGDFDLLKERLIGTELFGRPSDYDTGEDAIVRVAASDLRKRLLQFYGSGGAGGRIRIDLPTGSYIPAFSVDESSVAESVRTPKPSSEPAIPAPPLEPQPAPRNWTRVRKLAGIVAAVGLMLGVSFVLSRTSAPASPKSLPWSALFSGTAPQTNVILSDTNISALQFLLGFRLPLSDYANRRYMPNLDRPLSPEMDRVARGFTGIDYTAATSAIDAVTVLRVAQIAGAYSSRMKVRPARSLQLRDFETDENFILLGSPSSDPWCSLFAEQLDFAFDYDSQLHTEFLRNNHPRPGELARYVPTALGGATGMTFGIIAFTRNPNHLGHVLILAGTTAESTEAGAKLVSDLDKFPAILRRYGIAGSGSPRHFEILLGVEAMAGAPERSEILAVHTLADPPVAR
jgi:hypothetical protein